MTGERILLVEDAREMRDFLAEDVLKPAGYDVLRAKDGDEGFFLALELEPDLIISDYAMPGRDGLQMLADLEAEKVRLPFILITAEGSEALAVQALRLGVSDYLIKPFDPDDLLNSVAAVLQKYWAHQITQNVPEQLLQTNLRLEVRMREMDTLVQLGKQVTSLLDLQSVLDQVVNAAVRVSNAEQSHLLLINEQGDELYLTASTSVRDHEASFRLPVTDSMVGQVVQSGQPLIISGEEIQKIKTDYFVHDLAYVPLILQQRVIGVLGVTNHEQSRSFDPYAIQLLKVLADFAAIAIDNARLYSATEYERNTLNSILNSTEDVIIVVDTYQRILFCNPAACEAFHVDPETSIGQALADAITHSDVLELFEKQVRSGRGRGSEIELEDDNGRILNAQLTLVDGVGKVAVMQDITHLKELDRIKSDFVTSVSHDLRSPLTAILGYVELLSRSGPLNIQQQQFVERIIFSVQSITALISDLLELGKIEAGFDKDYEPTYLNLIVRYAVEGLRHQLESKQHVLHVDMPPTVPPVLGNPLRLRQMVNNLLENAIKYTPPQGEIRVSLEISEDFLVVCVTDTGIGIPPKDQPYVFDKFYRSDEAIDGYVGTGLGLSIVKSVVEQHNGRIWLESQLNKGCAFTVMLPVYEQGPYQP